MTCTESQLRNARRFSAAILLSVICGTAAAVDGQSVSRPHYVGSLSCSAVACHGRTEPRGQAGSAAQNEFVLWKQSDPHARSTETIWGEKFASILTRMGSTRDGQWSVQAYRRCAGCHDPQNSISVQVPVAQNGFAAPPAFEARGIGCESCHGAASQWIATHYERNAHPAQLASRGMYWTQNLFIRSQTCSACHVGSAENNMNHDMIAAGHPALRFEMTSYHGRLPKHWPALEERRSTPDFEAQLWSSGQLASTEAALQLLHHRAKESQNLAASKSPPWPELSEYSCRSCHQRLRTPDEHRRLRLTDKRLLPGQPAWNPWFMALPLDPMSVQADETVASSAAAWETLRSAMQQLSSTNAGEIVDLTQTTGTQLHRDLIALKHLQVGQRVSTFSTRDLTSIIRASATRADSWEELCQLFLALQAATRGIQDWEKSSKTLPDFTNQRPGLTSVPWQTDLESMRWSLAFEQDSEIPRALLTSLLGMEHSELSALPAGLRRMTLEEIRRQIILIAEQIEMQRAPTQFEGAPENSP